MPPRAELCHSTTGRLRLRVPEMRRNSTYFERLKDTFSVWPDVSAVAVNPSTGSALVLHRSTAHELVERAIAQGIFALEEPARLKEPMLNRASVKIARNLRSIDSQLTRASGGEMDLAGLTFAALIGAGIYQMAQGKILPAGITLFSYALNVLGTAESKVHGAE